MKPEFIQQLNKQTKRSYRLPTEAEWEFAARGGIHTEEYLYSGSDKLSEVGWYAANNAGNGTQALGQLLENELGLFDMSGNVRNGVRMTFTTLTKGLPLMARPGSIGLSVLGTACCAAAIGAIARYCRVSIRFHLAARRSR